MSEDLEFEFHLEGLEETLAQIAVVLNILVPIGTPVTYWTGTREGPGKRGKIRAPYSVVSRQLVGWVDTHPACILNSHIEPDHQGP